MSNFVWRKSSRSGSGAGNNCVEVAGNVPGVVAVRDSKDPQGGHLTVDPTVFAAFGRAVKAGRLDA